MERTRKHKSSSGGGGELHLVKAAAWAWFQQETVLDQGRSMKEFDIRRTFHDPKPSRYKLEAMELAKRDTENVDEGLKSPTRAGVQTTVGDHSLLDRYEIESISRQLDQLINSSGDKDRGYNKGFLFGDQYDGYLRCGRKCSPPPPPPPKLQSLTSPVGDLHAQEREPLMDSENYTNRGRKKKGNKFSGFWQRHAVICGSSTHEDVILGTRAFVDSGQRRQRQRQHPENLKAYLPVPVVKLANCRPGRHTRLVIS